MTTQLSVPDLITAIGVAALAREFGHENMSTVSGWKIRGSVPVAYWPRLVDIAAASGIEGVTYEALVHAHASHSHPDPAS